MSKELNAYRRLCSHLDYDNDDYMFDGGYEEDNEVVEKALTENDELRTRNYELLKESENFYNERNEYKRALKIIKEKQVHVRILLETTRYAEYNAIIDIHYANYTNYYLTKEEYDLLKKVLL